MSAFQEYHGKNDSAQKPKEARKKITENKKFPITTQNNGKLEGRLVKIEFSNEDDE